MRISPGLTLATVLLALASMASGQETPVISGAAGFVATNAAGQTTLQPIITPVGLIPIGSHLLVETSAEFQGFIARDAPDQPFEGQYFGTLEYLQLDYIVNRHVTFVAGRFLTPFNIYNERLGPLWIHDMQNTPIIFPIGTRTSASSDGAMLRGVALARRDFEWNYTAFFSAGSNVNKFESGRALGVRSGVFVPRFRFEIGGSYERFLEPQQHSNTSGMYLSWQPWSIPLEVRSEYAHSPQGQGYWIETAYQFKQSTPLGQWFQHMQGVARVQQFFRGLKTPSDALPPVDTTMAEFGLNYYLPATVRLSANYGRGFASTGNFNQWTFAITHRFTFPAFPGRSN